MSKNKNKCNIFSIILWIITMVSVGLITYEVYDANVLPVKYYGAIAGLIVFLIVIFFLFIKRRGTRKWILILNDIFFVIILGICGFGYLKLNELMTFLEDNLGATYETDIYYILSNKESKYKTVDDIKDKTVKLVDDLGDKETLEKSVKKKANVKFEYVDSISELLYEIETNPELIIVCNSGNYDAMVENDETLQTTVKFENKVNIIETVEIKYRAENTDTGIDVTEDAFAVYLSGIDTRSGKLPAKSLSDVNILMIINPNNHKILMINTPRDYYVQVNGTTGLKDKLTHAGLVGGVKTSMATISDLYNVDIKYYVRVNFNAVVKLVDAIGGITLYNDQNYNIKLHHDQTCILKPGDNPNKDGQCVLAFARERYAYKTGDRHRGENQEQVIQKVIEKVTSSKTLITKYNDILTALEGTFQTNISTDEITSLVKIQVDEMPSWSFETYNVTGTDLYSATYSYPKSKLYVMVPKQETVNIAKSKIQEALN